MSRETEARERIKKRQSTRGVFTGFCKGTSVRGVPRIFKSETLCLRVMWIFFVTGFLGLSVFNVTKLIMSYYEFEFFTQTKQRDITREESWQFFPAMTLCNLSPLSSNFTQLMRGENKDTLSEYFDKVESVIRLHKKKLDKQHNNDSSILNETLSHLLTFRGYHEHVGNETASKIGTQREQFILECKILGSDSVHTHEINCEDVTEFKRITSPDFFNCYTLSTKQDRKFQYWYIQGVSFVIYLDNFGEEYTNEFSNYIGRNHAAGVRLNIHSPGTLPMFISKGYDVPAGFATTIFQTLYEQRRLPLPYGDCYTEKDTPPLYYPDGSQREVEANYSQDLCDRICMQQSLKNCNCTDSIIPTSRDTLTFCGNLALNNETGLKYIKCMVNKYRKKYGMDDEVAICQKKCKPLCKDIYFIKETAMVPWPASVTREGFYNHYIKGKPFESNFSPINKSINITNAHLHDLLVDSNIARNFLKVTVKFSKFEVTVLEEIPKINDLNDFISQLGGALNFYAGITLVVVVEILELLINLCMRPHKYVTTNEKCNGTNQGSDMPMAPPVYL